MPLALNCVLMSFPLPGFAEKTKGKRGSRKACSFFCVGFAAAQQNKKRGHVPDLRQANRRGSTSRRNVRPRSGDWGKPPTSCKWVPFTKLASPLVIWYTRRSEDGRLHQFEKLDKEGRSLDFGREQEREPTGEISCERRRIPKA